MLLIILSATIAVGCATPASSHCEDTIARGRVQCHRTEDGLIYYSYVPPTAGPSAPLFVVVHGLTRNAEDYARGFAADAETAGAVLLAPLFDAYRYDSFQRLERERNGLRADLSLKRMMASLRARLGLIPGKVFLYGHSAGAQFAHRYMMAHPEDVAVLAVNAAGYYTWPDPALRYPLGVGGTSRDSVPRMDPRAFLQVPACALVGSDDVRRDDDLYSAPDVDALQGRTRLARATIWIEKMRAAARGKGYDTPYRLEVIRGADHSLASLMRRELASRVLDCFMTKAAAGT